MPRCTLSDIALYYERSGAGPPLVFIHGLGSSGCDWEAQVAHFAASYGVVTVDLRGHGRSEKPPGPYSIPQFAEDVAALLHTLDLAQAHVVGISLGGMVALQLALDAPALVRSLVIVNSTPEVVMRTWGEHMMLFQRRGVARLLGMRAVGRVLSKRLFPKPEHATVRQVFVERWAANDKCAYLEAIDAIVGWSVADRLAAITCPTLVVAADKDYIPVADHAAWAARLPHAELVVVEDARHGLPVERPEVFNQVVSTFLIAHA